MRFDYALGGYAAAACALALMFTGNFWLALAAAVTAGAAGNLYETAALSLMQLSVDEDRRGRVMANTFAVSQSAEAAGAGAAGALAAGFGLALPVFGLSGMCLLAGAFLWTRRAGVSAAFTRPAEDST